MASSGERPSGADLQTVAAAAAVPRSLFDAGAPGFWVAVILTGVAAGAGAALLTRLLKAVQGFAWGASKPSAPTEAARLASPLSHLLIPITAAS